MAAMQEKGEAYADALPSSFAFAHVEKMIEPLLALDSQNGATTA